MANIEMLLTKLAFGMRLFPWLRELWMVFLGLLLALSAPGFGWWVLAWVGLIPALQWVNGQQRWAAVFWGGFWFGFAFQGLYCSWFFDLHPLMWLGFSDLGSRLVTLAGWLLIATEGGLITAGLMMAYYAMKPRWLRLIGFPLIWVLGFSMLHATPMALPWGMLEYTQASLPLMRTLTGWVGASGLALLLVAHNVYWAECLTMTKTSSKMRWVYPLLLPLLLGGLSTFQTSLQSPGHSKLLLPLVAVQANLPIDVIRTNRLTLAEIETSYIQPLTQTHSPEGALVVYPEEGVVPGLVQESKPFQNRVLRHLQRLADDKQVFISVGVTFQDLEQKLHNTMLLITPHQPIQFYHKRKLVPFGEFTPYGFGEALQKLLKQWDVDYSAPFAEGQKSNLLWAGKIPMGGLICFELIDAKPWLGGFAEVYKRQGAKLLVNASNLGWFHQNPLMEAQFLAIGQMQAAESHLPLVISSNTGISAFIDDQGTILNRTSPFSKSSQKPQVIVLP